jgi:hypothetical protein
MKDSEEKEAVEDEKQDETNTRQKIRKRRKMK